MLTPGGFGAIPGKWFSIEGFHPLQHGVMKTLLAPSSLLLIAPLALVACGGGEPETTPDTPSTSGNDTAATTTPEPEAPKTPAPLADATADNPVVVAEDGSAAKVYLTGSDQMKYNLTEVAVPAGAEVTVTLVHVGKMPLTAMGHNVVFLKKGADVQKFAMAALAEDGKANDYIPPAMTDQVIANTKMIGGGETTTVTFTAPAAGTYEFICTFPGHFALMRGRLIVS